MDEMNYENNQKRGYRTTRGRKEVEVAQHSLGQYTPPEISQLFDWFLKKTEKFPELNKAIQYELPINNVSAKASPQDNSPQSEPQLDNSNKDYTASLDELLSPNGHSRSLNHLSNLTPPEGYKPLPSVDELHTSFQNNDYFIGKEEVFTIHEAISSAQPIIVDGPSGTGKTELAYQIAIALGLDVENSNHMGKLFCTPDVSKAESIYEWNDAKRLMDQQLVKDLSMRLNFENLMEIYKKVSTNTYSERYLNIQILLRHCVIPYRTVVLIDEVDKTYPEFDNYLLDILINNNFEVPEYGMVGRPNKINKDQQKHRPIFILTTNRERDLSSPLVRRCKPLWFDYLPENLETKVLEAKCNLTELEAGRVAQFFHKIRSDSNLQLQQQPSTAEVIETVNAINRKIGYKQFGVDPRENAASLSQDNLLRHNCHWIKSRRDFESVKRHYSRNGEWIS